MSIVDISTINLIPELVNKIDFLTSEIKDLKQELKPKYDLTKRSNVLLYLKISESTLSRYIKEGIFRQGYHYNREIKGSKSIITYVSGAIEEFKKLKEE